MEVRFTTSLDSEADTRKRVRPEDICAQSRGGARSRPLRKRGWRRAERRGEVWALVQWVYNEAQRELEREMFAWLEEPIK